MDRKILRFFSHCSHIFFALTLFNVGLSIRDNRKQISFLLKVAKGGRHDRQNKKMS